MDYWRAGVVPFTIATAVWWIGALPALAQCATVNSSTVTCTGDFEGTSITNLPGAVPPADTVIQTATTVNVNDLTADVGPGEAVGAAVFLNYEASPAPLSPIALTVSSDDFSLLVSDQGAAVAITSMVGQQGSTNNGAVGRDLNFISAIDIDGQLSSGESTPGVNLTTLGGTGIAATATGGTGGSGGAAGAVTVNGSGTYSVSGDGDLTLGVGVVSIGGDGGKGQNNGGDGGVGGAGGAVSLTADGTWTINASGDLTSGQQGGVVVQTTGGVGGQGGDGNNEGTAAKGGVGGNINFDGSGNSAWVVNSTGVPGFFLVSEGGQAGDVGGGTPDAGGNGGTITKNDGSTIEITTTGDSAVGFMALSRGGKGTRTNDNYGDPGSGGAITINDSWTVSTAGTLAHGIAAYSLGGAPFSDSDRALSGDGGTVTVDVSGIIQTSGDQSFGIVAQSVGGHDGSGGTTSSPSVEFSATENTSTGSSGLVQVTSGATITTTGQESAGIGIQSIGSGGGALGTDFNDFFSGTSDVIGGDGGTVTIDNSGAITTTNAGADAILAQSIGGAGGTGSSSTSDSGLGSNPKNGSNGGDVTVTNSGTILAGGTSFPVTIDTSAACGGGCSVGIFAQSVGGGGGKGHTASGSFASTGGKGSSGGDGGDGGSGGTVTVTNSGDVSTFRDHSAAIEAQSVGGGGGQGGGAVSGGVFSHSVGGQGGNGGKGGIVNVQNTFASLVTNGDNSDGIHAHSVGGGGGRGGYAISGSVQGASFAVGGAGGAGGAGAAVTVCLDGTTCEPTGTTSSESTTIVTNGNNAKGVFAHSVGGGGGNGGFSVAATAGVEVTTAVSVGGSGGSGGSSALAQIGGDFGSIMTAGDDSTAVKALSVGGGGGNGGLSVSGTVTIAVEEGASFGVSVGGSGGSGGHAGEVDVNVSGDLISTTGDRSSGVFGQSVGGGGGNGGASVALGITTTQSANVNVAIGGSGGDGGDSADVSVAYAPGSSSGTIMTSGDSAHGLVAQSIAGGGGHGGVSIAGGISGAQSTDISVSLGGKGGGGGQSGAVTASNSGEITTAGVDSHGILAQSAGGGGGYGGLTVAGSVSGSQSIQTSVSLGESGGDGGAASTVKVTNQGTITVTGAQAKGIIAQSIGGAGGHGSLSVTGSIVKSDDSKSANVTIGGTGGKGGAAAQVVVNNSAAISTGQSGTTDSADFNHEYGILAQSISGDGGFGGMAVSSQTNQGQKSVEVSIGGKGGNTSAAGMVQVNNSAAITTNNDDSTAILAQSIGGNGGAGGSTVNAQYTDSDADSNTYSVAIGGGGGSGAKSEEVKVIHTAGDILTMGANSGGIVAQSVGGGGGQGGSNVAYSASNSGNTNRTDASKVSFNLGASGGDGSAAGTVFIQVSGGSIETGAGDVGTQTVGDNNDRGHGIFGLSQGGGGGAGGIGMVGNIDTSVGSDNEGGSATIGGAGGSSATGNNVTITVSDAPITTHLQNSHGILAQSIGGGGGNGGIGIKGNVTTSGNKGFVASLGGLSGKGSSAGTTSVTVSSAIVTQAAGSAGIVAQSIGGGGGDGGIGIDGSVTSSDKDNDESSLYSLALGASGADGSHGGAVDVTLAEGGSITTNATATTPDNAAHGILAQSIGGGGGRGGYGISGDLSTNESSGRTAVAAVGGPGGGGGAGGDILIDQNGTISVAGDFAVGVKAQSIGGGGGTGGFAIGGELQTASGLELTIGASGGSASDGGTINDPTKQKTIGGDIATAGDFGHGVLLQSIGGGGGTGGVGVGGSFSDSGSDQDIALIVGGSGGSGGAGGDVYFNVGALPAERSTITTAGNGAIGILAQSIGGGGGAAASALNGTVSSDSSANNLTVALGGTGGSGGAGSTVEIMNVATIETGTNANTANERVSQAFGILAQSIGGGGGQAMHGGALTTNGESMEVSMGIGGTGVEGDAGSVSVTNNGTITTYGVDSHALVAQAISGGGGVSGIGASISSQKGTELTHGAGLGGTGSGNRSYVLADTTVVSQADITTNGEGAHGILAQSIIGGGGYATSIFGIEQLLTNASEVTVGVNSGTDTELRLGGTKVVVKPPNGSENAAILNVNVTNSANITTSANGAVGILAQSVGGGGGVAYDGGYNGKTFAPFGSLSAEYTIGGSDVGGEDNNSRGAGANHVTVTHQAGTITSAGFSGAGIYAQSVGGGGGRGFVGVDRTGSGSVTVGGTEGTEGYGGNVTVDVTGGSIIAGVDDDTYAVSAFGVFAQSVGGGGGHGGVADFQGAIVGTKLAESGSGFRNTSGFGGDVKVTIGGSVSTFGNSSVGVFAQSVAGGGGVLGTNNASTAVSLGSNGGNGKAGDVTVTVDSGGSVSTVGQAAHGIFAQSASGDNHEGGKVSVTVNSGATVSATGQYAYAIWADAPGGNGKGSVDIDISSKANVVGGKQTGALSASATLSETSTADGAVTGGLQAAGVVITNAATASITNTGSITTVDGVSGDSIRSLATSLRINNKGTLIGDLHSDGNRTAVRNFAAGTLMSGETYHLGTNGILTNAGRFEILGDGTTGTTALTGDFVQSSSGVMAIDIDADNTVGDALTVTGSAVVGGQIVPTLTSLGPAGAGRQTLALISADEGVELASDGFSLAESAVAAYETALRDQELDISYNIDFSVPDDRQLLTSNERSVADFLARLHGLDELEDTLLLYANAGGIDEYAALLHRSGGVVYAQNRQVMLFSTLDFENASSACDVHGQRFKAAGREYCAFLQAGGSYLEADDSRTSRGFDNRSFSVAGGLGFDIDAFTGVEAAFQYVSHDISSSGGASSDGNTIQGLVRAKRSFNDNWFAVHFGGGTGWFDVARPLPFGGTITEEQSVPFINAGADVSRRFGSERFFVEPKFMLGMTHYLSTSNTENGTSGFELVVDAEAQTLVYARPSVRVGTTMALSDDIDLEAFANFGLTGFLGSDDTQVKASFVTASSEAGTFKTEASPDNLLADFDVGLGLASADGWHVRAEGFARLSENIAQAGGGLRFGLEF